MKRSLFVAACVLLVSSLFTSCQKEEKNIVELTQDLTAELQKITDTASANAHAERVSVLNRRYQDASVRVFALNNTSLARGADSGDHEGASYAAALKDLTRELGRVRASFPSASSDSKVDRDRLLVAIGAANGESDPAKCKEAGLRYLHDEGANHETPGNFPEYYGSAKLREALAYRAPVSDTLIKFDSDADVPGLPALGAEQDDSAAADDEEDNASASTGSSSSTAAPAADDSDDDSSDSSDDGEDDDSDSSDSSDSNGDSSMEDIEFDL